jgi:two-component system sensor histidine kinase MprB
VTVRGEADALRRALDNLLDNAEVHGPRGGEVTVSLTVSDGVAALAVADEGPGLDPADLEHAFERFWRAPDAADRPGSGLGLAIVRATAQRHGGHVTVDGSTVTIELPTTVAAAEAVHDPAR